MIKKPTKDEIDKMTLSEYVDYAMHFCQYCYECGQCGDRAVIESIEGKGHYYCEDQAACKRAKA